MHKIIDDFLPKPYFVELQNIVDSADFAWYWQDDQINGNTNESTQPGVDTKTQDVDKSRSDGAGEVNELVEDAADESSLQAQFNNLKDSETIQKLASLMARPKIALIGAGQIGVAEAGVKQPRLPERGAREARAVEARP